MDTTDEPLDLYDIAVLLNYERATTEPRFRHTKLREVALPGTRPKTVAFKAPNEHEWIDNDCTWVVLDQVPDQSSDRDLFSDFLPEGKKPGGGISEQELETLFYQVRCHDGGYINIGLLQILFNMFPNDTKLKIRHAPKNKSPGESYITSVTKRVIIEEPFMYPKTSMAIAILPENQLLVSGNMPNFETAIMGFGALDDPSDEVKSYLDLSSMQFGDAGRGPGLNGKQLFALDTTAEHQSRVMRTMGGNDPEKTPKTSGAIRGTPYDDWLTEVATRVKKKWDNRHEEHWCGHCGSPDATSKCAGCGQAWYCGKDHQKVAWGFHRGYCNKA
ncbi:hypothetical protein CC86DRAFT_187080 [Ophiobolus disseminans]|uniref:MYND-type domain-containing protein n=1 Tax=Ophiobolus disseminans TaxID=1469910 RepID=A0A6A7A7G1_9PLEO|nr:hypothetical protein CC86DRAFT_187080 [Ophiobolus disseminans]